MPCLLLLLGFFATGFSRVAPASSAVDPLACSQEAPALAGHYRNQDFGYEIIYPTGWRFVEAAQRAGPGSRWAAEVLSGDEQQKVTFLEPGDRMWPGEFQVQVLANPVGASLDAWTDEYSSVDVVDAAGGSLVTDMREASLGGLPARRLEVFMFDHSGVRFVTMWEGRVYLLSHVGKTPNDPNLEEHSRLYEAMVQSFRFVDEARDN